MSPPLSKSVLDAFNFAGQPNGWMSGPIFLNIIENGFVKEINEYRAAKGEPNEVVLLILDHHSSRDSLDAKSLYENHKILVLIIPAHSSAITQPLDLSVNQALKKKLGEHFADIPGESVPDRRNRLLQLCDLALSHAICRGCIIDGFNRTGLFPYNPEIPLKSGMVIAAIDPIPIVQEKSSRKRGPNIAGGKIMFDGQVVVSPEKQ